MNFKLLNLSETLLEAISYMGFEEATPIQEQAIPAILQKKDLLACAQTGTGKTAAFILPVLNALLNEKEHNQTKVLVIVPTRELALQIDQQIQGFSYFTNAESIAVYGGGSGSDWEQQKKALKSGTEIVVATPGKLISHLAMGYVNFDHVKYLILDEADRMLDMGFYDDIRKIISYLPKERQTLMFSATMPPKIKKLASGILKNPVEITIGLSKPAEGVSQEVYAVFENAKVPLVKKIICNAVEAKSILVFSSTKKKVGNIVQGLRRNGYRVEGISSDLEQEKREEVLNDFRSRQTLVLVTTDVLSRGIDIKDIDMVINFDVPGDAEDYVHRVGRTARAESKGRAVTLVSPDEMYKLFRIETLIGRQIERKPFPKELGDAPEWKKPKAKKSNYGKKGRPHGGKRRKNFNPGRKGKAQ